MKRLLLILLAAAAPAFAQDSWTRGDTIRQGVIVAASAVDWLQTLDIQDHDCMWEQNPVMGHKPSRARVNEYFLASMGAHFVIARLLPRKWREGFQYLSIGMEVGMIAHNYHIGLRVKF